MSRCLPGGPAFFPRSGASFRLARQGVSTHGAQRRTRAYSTRRPHLAYVQVRRGVASLQVRYDGSFGNRNNRVGAFPRREKEEEFQILSLGDKIVAARGPSDRLFGRRRSMPSVIARFSFDILMAT
jgi:hypothetical protein